MPDKSKFKIGDRVWSSKGCRIKGESGGIVVGFGKWRVYPAVRVKKPDGKVRLYLEKNLIKTG